MKKYFFLILLSGLIAMQLKAQQQPAQNVIIITLDGFRWQEMFNGADEVLINDPSFSFDTADLKKKYWAATPEERRKKLMPFVWSVIAKEGQLHGNRVLGSKMNVTNNYWFSYPGYNEIFTGYPDTAVNSNDKNLNKNTTVLEFLHNKPAFKGKVAAFTSWDCFDAIFNEPRAGFPVSSGFDKVNSSTPQMNLLNDMQMHSPKPLGDGVRPDFITYYLAKEYLKEKKPRILYIGFDETDDYAHGGRYDYYLNMANMTDNWIADLWSTIQSIPEYKGKTALLITTDHGRGDAVKSEWTSHGSKIKDAYQIWMAALGAGIPSEGEIKKEEQLYQAQIAATIAMLLGESFTASQPIANAMAKILN